MMGGVRDWMLGLGRWPLILVATMGGAWLGLTTPPGIPPTLIWLGFVLHVLVARALQPGRFWSSFVPGWFGGLGIGFLGFPWIALTLRRFAQAPIVLAAGGLGLFS